MQKAIALKQRLRRQEPVYGILHGLASPAAAEMAALAGYDVVIIDDEHGPSGRDGLLALAQAIAAGGAASLLRMASHAPLAIGQALDLGIDGLIFSGVESVEQAVALVAATRYPPLGIRGNGVGIARASGYGLFADRYRAQAAEGPFVCAIVESRRGVEAARAIAAVDGIDAIVVGIHDLSGDLGVPGNVVHPSVQEALSRVEQDVVAVGKAVGTITHPGADVAALLARGHRFITLGADTRLLGAAMRAQLEACTVGTPAVAQIRQA